MTRASLVALAALLAIASLTGCGSSTNTTTSQKTTQASNPPPTTTTNPTTPPSPTTTASTPATQTTPARKPERVPPTGQITLLSPAVNAEGELAARYTCNGQDTPPPMEWKGVPPQTAELMIAIMQTKNDANGKIHFIWAATHIPPTPTGKIIGGKLPPGAVTATNSNGKTKYHLCPPKGTQETYVTVIFALPHKLPAQQGFNPTTLRHQAEHQATHQNLLFYHYTQH